MDEAMTEQMYCLILLLADDCGLVCFNLIVIAFNLGSLGYDLFCSALPPAGVN
jgi:hypothetical protein